MATETPAADWLTGLAERLNVGETVLTPNLRLARAITAQWAKARPQEVVATPTATALGAWLASQWIAAVEAGILPLRRVLTPLEAEELWLRVIVEALSRDGEFTLLQPTAAARLAHRTREALLQRRCDIHRSAGVFELDSDCARFYEWLQDFEQHLSREGWCTQADMEGQLLGLPEPRCDAVVLVEDESLTPLSRAALHCAVSRVETVVMPEADRRYEGATYATVEEELAAAAHWAVALHRQGSGPIALVVPDLAASQQRLDTALRAAFGRLDSRYDALPVNYSRGIASAAAPMYRDLLTLLRVLQGDVSRADLLSVARSPYLAVFAGISAEQRVQLVNELFRLGADPIPRLLFHDALNRYPTVPLAQLLREVATGRALRERRSAAQWRDVFRGWLLTVAWPARPDLDSYEYQQWEQSTGLFDTFERVARVHGAMPLSEAVAVLGRVLQRQQFQPITANDAIQVLSPREVRGLPFAHLWLLGAQAGQVPARPERWSFIPGSIQRALQMPATVDPDGLASGRRFLRLLAAQTNDLQISWHRAEAGVEQLPSPLLDDEKPPTVIGMSTTARWQQALPDDAVVETEVDDCGSPLPAGPVAVNGGSGLIADQSQCAFRGWARHRLKIRRLESPATGLSPIERGNALHKTLELLWRGLATSDALSKLTDAALDAEIAECAARAVRDFDPRIRQRVGEGCLLLESQRLVATVREWMLIERARGVSFRVVNIEEPDPMTLDRLTFNLRTDRVDELPDGRRVVVDYKSSDRYQVAYWWGDRVREPQLPMYALVDSAAEGIAYGVIGSRRRRFLAIGEGLGLGEKGTLSRQLKDEEIADWSTLRDGWRLRLERVASEFAAGAATVDPLPGACEFCDYRPMCRVDETNPGDDEVTP